jgi:hypothetical protein
MNWKIQLRILMLMSYTTAVCSDQTELNLYRPFAASAKHPSVVIEVTRKGYCVRQSYHTIREDAWHCESQDGVVYDPCFSKRFHSNQDVICPRSPWEGHSTRLLLDAPLNMQNQQSLDMSRSLPWAIELKQGVRCISVLSQQTYDGLPVHYQCADGQQLIGEPHRCQPIWSILKHDVSGPSQVDMKTAWF